MLSIIAKKEKMMEKLKRSMLISYAFIALGTLLCVFALNAFLVPHKLSMGGYTGLASVFYYVFNIPVGAGVFILNIPTFYFAFKRLGKSFCLKSLFAMVLLSVLTDALPQKAVLEDSLASAVYGGAAMGAGLGINIYFGGSTGGTDLLSILISRRVKGASVSTVLFVLDAVIVALTAIFLGPQEALLSLAAVYAVIKCIDAVTGGVKRAKVFIIISSKHEKIKSETLKKLARGITVIYGEGGYTGSERKVLLCTVSMGAQTQALKDIIKEADPEAFIISVDAAEIIGRGF